MLVKFLNFLKLVYLSCSYDDLHLDVMSSCQTFYLNTTPVLLKEEHLSAADIKHECKLDLKLVVTDAARTLEWFESRHKKPSQDIVFCLPGTNM